MSKNSRRRRAARARKSAARHTPGPQSQSPRNGSAPDPARVREASSVLREVALWYAGRGFVADASARFAQFAEPYQQLAVDDQLVQLIRIAVSHGWTPDDLRAAAAIRLGSPSAHDFIDRAAHGRATPSAEYATEHGHTWASLRPVLISALALLASLPKLPQAGRADGVEPDDRVLRRVRALLAKAEATDYPEEADALTAKAQQLMARHSIEDSVAAKNAQQRDQPIVRRIWLDAPYVDPKSSLVSAVARANRCRSIFTGGWGFVTLVGFPTDVQAVELLTTSLLVQASRAMTATGSRVERGVSRTRSFRRSFLLAYAARIGERLDEAAAVTAQEADAEFGGALVLVRTARDDDVTREVERLFPSLVFRTSMISNYAGWYAGQTAADLAELSIRRKLRADGSQ
jgi:hypothetical protein